MRQQIRTSDRKALRTKYLDGQIWLIPGHHLRRNMLRHLAHVVVDINLNPKDIQMVLVEVPDACHLLTTRKIAAEVADKLEDGRVIPVTSMDAMTNGSISDHRQVR